MYKFGEKHPVIFEIILIILSFLAAAVFVAAGSIFNIHPDLCSSVGRILVGAFLALLYRRAFTGVRTGENYLILLPALLFAAWNLFYNLSLGMEFGGPAYFIEAAITAAAPAVFEEVLFRGIFLYNLKKKGSSDLACMLISSILFAAVHLTNIVGMNAVNVGIQFGYSLVIGMVLAAVYLKNRSMLQIIVLHFLIDFMPRIFVEQAASASTMHLILFGILLAAEAAYAVKLCLPGKQTADATRQA